MAEVRDVPRAVEEVLQEEHVTDVRTVRQAPQRYKEREIDHTLYEPIVVVDDTVQNDRTKQCPGVFVQREEQRNPQ